MKKFTIALLYNLKINAPKDGNGEKPWDAWNELDNEKSVGGIERALRAGGHEVIGMEGDANLLQKLSHYKIDIAFNTCEGHRGGSRESQAPAMLDQIGMPYTGSGVMALALALDKPMTKRILRFHHLPTPPFQTFFTGNEPLAAGLDYPLFVKPSREGSGMGVTAKSVCRNARELREQVRYIIQAYHEPALAEEFIEGRELTMGLLGNAPWHLAPRADESRKANGNGRARNGLKALKETLRVFPPLEVDLSPVPAEEGGLYTSVVKGKLYEVPKYLCPAPVSKAMRAQLDKLSVAAFNALECFDFARIDFRIDQKTGAPLILEVNPLAGLQEGISDIVMAAEADGVDYVALINGILNAALQRYGMI
ncbi:MAG: hypothetical protein HY327_01210 [Chloroflexi bacterium]|nr:hypothetical protein [Chloroflexota bacterium]